MDLAWTFQIITSHSLQESDYRLFSLQLSHYSDYAIPPIFCTYLFIIYSKQTSLALMSLFMVTFKLQDSVLNCLKESTDMEVPVRQNYADSEKSYSTTWTSNYHVALVLPQPVSTEFVIRGMWQVQKTPFYSTRRSCKCNVMNADSERRTQFMMLHEQLLDLYRLVLLLD
jgi:hypothetical protein